MPKIIEDEFTNLSISPQVRYQRRREAAMKCRICGGQGSPYCAKHLAMQRAYSRARVPFIPRAMQEAEVI